MPELVFVIADIQQWVDTRTFDDICIIPSNSKVSCLMDYSWDTSMESACQSLNQLYVEVDYTFRCLSEDPNSDEELFFSARSFPACIAASCGIEGAIVYQSDQVDLIGEGLEENGWSCQRMKFEVYDIAALEAELLAKVSRQILFLV